jgi:SAM-dependent methyltransferase
MTTVRSQTPEPAETPPKLMRPLFQQFARPSGWLGRIAGSMMAKAADDDRWLVDLLDSQPEDRVLEVGFGPGVAIELLAARVSRGLVAGIDPSEVMVRQATNRNRRAVQAGRVQLRQATVSALPFPDGSFTSALTLHSIYFWPSLEQGLRELYRVLSPGGRLAIAVRMYAPAAGRLTASRYGLTDDQVRDHRGDSGICRFRGRGPSTTRTPRRKDHGDPGEAPPGVINAKGERVLPAQTGFRRHARRSLRVNLGTHRPIDPLDERAAEVLANWPRD